MTNGEAFLDKMLDRAVVPGYSRIGYALRRPAWDRLPDHALAGRTVLVTGGTAGIGREIAAGCARLGAIVHVLGRNRARGEEAMRRLRREVPGADLVLEQCDLGSLSDVRRFCADFSARVATLDGLVHNAGLMVPERTETDEGHELTFSTHVLGPHLMTGLLADALAASDRGRVVFMSSGGMYPIPLVDDLEFRDGGYTPTKAYARTKRMQVVLAELWAERLRARGVSVHAMHPGWVDTPGVRTHLTLFWLTTRLVLRPEREGADTAVWLLATDHLEPATGGFWHDRQARPTHWTGRTRETEEQRRRFWDYCEAALAE